MAKSKSDTSPSSPEAQHPNSQDAKLEAIKEILFGQNIREYEQEFAEIKKILEEIRQEMKEDLNTARNDLEMIIQGLEAENEKQHENLRSWADGEFNRLSSEIMDRSLLGDMLVEIGRKIKA